jgi:uncharacterized protein (TIGR01319 family)
VAVIGLERDITTEAARRVALNSGGRIVATVSGELGDAAAETLRASMADIALIVGGTDGGNPGAVVDRARAVAATLPRAAAIVAGNACSAAEAAVILERAGIETTVVANVLPQIGVLVAAPARDAIRTAFIRHVIGGKHLSSESGFSEIVLMPTPDAVLAAVELLAGALQVGNEPRTVIVADVGGATTDLYSAAGSSHSGDRGFVAVPTLPVRRTVEADIGLRWSAPGIVESAAALGLISTEDEARLRPAASRRAAQPWMLAAGDEDGALDAELAALAVTVALLRHAGEQELMLARDGMEVRRDGPDLRGRALLVLTGGVFRARGGAFVETRTTAALDSFDRRRHLLPSALEVVVDHDYLLAGCGLLATRDRDAAGRLLRSALPALFEVEASHV